MMHLSGESGLGRALHTFRPLQGKRVALLEADGLDWARLAALKEAFELAGAKVVLVGPTSQIRPACGARLRVDACLPDTSSEVYHALCIPGTSSAVEALLGSPDVAEFVSAFVHSGKWIATLDHGPRLLEGVARGRTVTSDPELRAGLEQAGAAWVSEAVIVDQQLITAQGSAQLEPLVRMVSLCLGERRSGSSFEYHRCSQTAAAMR